MKTALVCGVTGQDGALMARLLLNKGYTVFGTTRESGLAPHNNLERLGIADRVSLLIMNQSEFRSVLSAVVRSAPDEIYFLSGQSSVGASYSEPAETFQSMAVGPLHLLEAVRLFNSKARIFTAASSEMFGPIADDAVASEATPLNPQSPYGVAKASGYWLVRNYRETYGIHASNGILFNHESALRPQRFVTQKIIAAAKAIRDGSAERLTLGNLAIVRDWGWADEYVDAMWQMLQCDAADDYIVATGQSHSLEDFVAYAFEAIGRDWRDHVDSDAQFFRPGDIPRSAADAGKARERLGWQARSGIRDIIDRMIANNI